MQVSDMIPRVNIIDGKVSSGSINGAEGSGSVLRRIKRGFRGRKFLDFIEHLDWLKTDLNAAKIITVQDYKHKKN